MPKPVTPYQEQDSKTWSFRIQRNGRRTYHSGFMSKTAAWEALAAMATDSARSDKPAGIGPHQTSVAVALSDYAQQCLPFRKGAPQEARRINRFLRAADLPILKLTPTTSVAPTLKAAMRGDKKQTVYFQVALVRETTCPIPNSLREHRAHPWLTKRFARLYQVLYPLRNTLIHAARFHATPGGVTVAPSLGRGAYSESKASIHAVDIEAMAALAVILARTLDGSWKLNPHLEMQLKWRLDQLTLFHGEDVFGAKKPQLSLVRILTHYGLAAVSNTRLRHMTMSTIRR